MPEPQITIPVGVCVFPQPRPNMSRTAAYPAYIHEILGHAGVCYFSITTDDLITSLRACGVLVTVGEFALDEASIQSLSAWVHGGGCWISIAGLCGLVDLFGVEADKPPYTGWGISLSTLGEGYAHMSNHIICADVSTPLHFFNGIAVNSIGGEVHAIALDNHQRPTSRAAIIENAVGSGRAILIAPDITGTIVRIQQGIGVTRDGVSAPDATGPLMDDVLKTGDGAVLDWHFDRREIPGVPGLKGYLDPVADAWREVLLRAIFYMAQKRNLSVPVLWLYPRNLPALAHMSHDTDSNEPEMADGLLSILAKGDIKSTWCVILPGYDEGRMRAIVEAGHELAMHYDAMTEGLEWSEDQFDRQHRELVALFNNERPVTNKNHYMRWEGDTTLWDWCVARGIEIDQSKGASKAGEVGYNFGTCHPHFPVRMNGEKINILELATPTQDFEIFVPHAVLGSLLKTVLKRHGVLHILFHPAHVKKAGVEDSILETISKAKAAGLEWWPARDINAWERARREVKWEEFSPDIRPSVRASATAELKDATLLWLLPEGVDGNTTRWGFAFFAMQHTFRAGEKALIFSEHA